MTNEEMELQIKQIIETNQFISPYSKEQRVKLGQYVSYRCLTDMSKVAEEYSHMKKDDLMQLIRSFEPFRMAVRSIIFYVLLHFDLKKFQFDMIGEAALWDDKDKADILSATRIYLDEEGSDLVNMFIVRAEFAHYLHLCENKGPAYSWTQYLENLMENEELMNVLNQTLIDGILQLNFKDMQPWKDLYRMLAAQYGAQYTGE